MTYKRKPRTLEEEPGPLVSLDVWTDPCLPTTSPFVCRKACSDVAAFGIRYVTNALSTSRLL